MGYKRRTFTNLEVLAPCAVSADLRDTMAWNINEGEQADE